MPTPKQKKAPGTAGRKSVAQPDRIQREIAHLESLPLKGLRDLWQRRFDGAPPPIQSSGILRRLMAWRLQVEAFGDLNAETSLKLRQAMRTGERGSAGLMPVTTSLKPGSVLVREWRGIEHRVLVLETGFEHRDRRYRSL